MNLQNIFELKTPSKDDVIKGASNKDENGKSQEQRVNIRDPLARRILDKARAKYAYTETDLEAFVKMMQDEQYKDRQEIEDLEDRERKLEKRESELEHDLDVETKKRKSKIKQLQQQFDQDIAEIEARTEYVGQKTSELENKEKEYEQKVAGMSSIMDNLLNIRGVFDKRIGELEATNTGVSAKLANVNKITKNAEALATHASEIGNELDTTLSNAANRVDYINNLTTEIENESKERTDHLDGLTIEAENRIQKVKSQQEELEGMLMSMQDEWNETTETMDQMIATAVDQEMVKRKQDAMSRIEKDTIELEPDTPKLNTDIGALSGEKLDRQEEEDNRAAELALGKLTADEITQWEKGKSAPPPPLNRQGRNPQTGEPIDLAGRNKRSKDKHSKDKKSQNESKIMEADTPLKDRADFLAKSKELFNLQATWAELLGRDKVSEEDYNDMMEFVQKRILRLRNEAIKKGIISESENQPVNKYY